MNIADVLERAAEHVRQGWSQGCIVQFDDGEAPKVCASGAIWLAAFDFTAAQYLTNEDASLSQEQRHERSKVWATAMDELFDHLKCQLPVSEWNDRPERTQAEVVEAMLQTAKKLRNEAVAT